MESEFSKKVLTRFSGYANILTECKKGVRMKIIITAEEAINRGVWEKLCDMKGINVWAVNEDLMDNDQEITLTEEEARILGLGESHS